MSDSFNNTNQLAEDIRSSVVSRFDALQTGASTVYSYDPTLGFPTVASGYGEVVLETPLPGAVTLPATFPVLFDTIADPATVIGNGGDTQGVVANSGGLTFQFFGGNGGVVYTANNPVGNAPSTGDSIFLDSNGTVSAALGQGQDTVVVDAGTNFIALGSGANQVFLNAGANVVASEGDDQIVISTDPAAASATATLVLSGNATVFGGATPLLLIGGDGVVELDPQTDPTTGVQTSTGAVTAYGGAGGAILYGGTDGNNVLVAGGGASTLVGGGANDLLFATGNQVNVLQATGANTFLVGAGASGDNQYFLGPDDTVLFGGAGQEVYVAGTGNATLVAGSGADQFDFTASEAGGVEAIFGFKAATDQINLFGYDTGDGSAAINAFQQASFNQADGYTYLVLGDNTTIVLVGAGPLTQANFAA